MPIDLGGFSGIWTGCRDIEKQRLGIQARDTSSRSDRCKTDLMRGLGVAKGKGTGRGKEKGREEITYVTMKHPSTGIISRPPKGNTTSRRDRDRISTTWVGLTFFQRRVDGGIV